MNLNNSERFPSFLLFQRRR